VRIAHIALCCKVGELDEVATYYKKLGFVVYKTNVTDIIKWARRRRADARAPQLLAPLALGKAWVGV